MIVTHLLAPPVLHTPPRLGPLAEAIRISGELAVALSAPLASMQGVLDASFRLLKEVIEALPPTVVSLSTMCYLRMRVESSSLLHDAEEYHASIYQLREMSRKLARIAATAD